MIEVKRCPICGRWPKMYGDDEFHVVCKPLFGKPHIEVVTFGELYDNHKELAVTLWNQKVDAHLAQNDLEHRRKHADN